MDLKFTNALLGSLQRQRDQALNSLAQVEASLELVTVENTELKEQLAKLQQMDLLAGVDVPTDKTLTDAEMRALDSLKMPQKKSGAVPTAT